MQIATANEVRQFGKGESKSGVYWGQEYGWSFVLCDFWFLFLFIILRRSTAFIYIFYIAYASVGEKRSKSLSKRRGQ